MDMGTGMAGQLERGEGEDEVQVPSLVLCPVLEWVWAWAVALVLVLVQQAQVVVAGAAAGVVEALGLLALARPQLRQRPRCSVLQLVAVLVLVVAPVMPRMQVALHWDTRFEARPPPLLLLRAQCLWMEALGRRMMMRLLPVQRV